MPALHPMHPAAREAAEQELALARRRALRLRAFLDIRCSSDESRAVVSRALDVVEGEVLTLSLRLSIDAAIRGKPALVPAPASPTPEVLDARD